MLFSINNSWLVRPNPEVGPEYCCSDVRDLQHQSDKLRSLNITIASLIEVAAP